MGSTVAVPAPTPREELLLQQLATLAARLEELVAENLQLKARIAELEAGPELAQLLQAAVERWSRRLEPLDQAHRTQARWATGP